MVYRCIDRTIGDRITQLNRPDPYREPRKQSQRQRMFQSSSSNQADIFLNDPKSSQLAIPNRLVNLYKKGIIDTKNSHDSEAA